MKKNNPLIRHTNIFANGKFKVEFNMPDSGLNWVDTRHDTIVGIKDKGLILDQNTVTPRVDNCTLIARPIADMTDREFYQTLVRDSDISAKMHEYSVSGSFIHYQQYRRNGEGTELRVIHVKDLAIDSFLYLLSIGVYPFDQSHFDDGTVIDISNFDSNDRTTGKP